METVWDWLAIAIFAGLLVIFLQRSVGPRPKNDRMINYLPPAVGCALGNYSGNEGQPALAVILLLAVVVYVVLVIKPLSRAE